MSLEWCSWVPCMVVLCVLLYIVGSVVGALLGRWIYRLANNKGRDKCTSVFGN